MNDTIIFTVLAVLFAAIFIASRWQTIKERRANPQPRVQRASGDAAAILAGCGWLSFAAFFVVVTGALFKIGWNVF